MSIRTVIKYDFSYIRRTKLLWTVGGIMTLLAGMMAYVFDREPRISWTDVLAVNEVFVNIIQIMSVIIPIVALVGAYMAITGERDTGRIKFLLSLPNSRRAVFLGKLASRSAAVGISLTVTFALLSVVIALKHGVFPANVFAGVFLLTLLFGQAFVSIAISLSAMVASRARTVAGVAGTYVVFVVFYVFPVINIRDVVRWIHGDVLGLAASENLYDFVFYLSPLTAYHKSMNLVIPVELESRPFVREEVTDPTRKAAIASELPTYLSDEFGLMVLLFWVIVPVVVGYVAFSRAELL